MAEQAKNAMEQAKQTAASATQKVQETAGAASKSVSDTVCDSLDRLSCAEADSGSNESLMVSVTRPGQHTVLNKCYHRGARQVYSDPRASGSTEVTASIE